MTKLTIRLGNQVDTIEADTRTKLIAAIKAGLPSIAPETVTVLIDADESLTNQAKNTVSVDAMWGEVRDNALKKAARMLELGSSMGADGAAAIHQLINLARRAEKRISLGPDHEEPLMMPKTTRENIDKRKLQDQELRDREAMCVEE